MNQCRYKSSVIGSAVAAALGATAMVAQADPVTGFQIKDVGSNSANAAGSFDPQTDGISGAFRFSSNYINVSSYAGTNAFTGDAGSGVMLGQGQPNPTGSFSTGFIYSGAPFTPYTFGNNFVAELDVNRNLSVTMLDWGGNFGPGQDFNLPPDAGYPIEVLWVSQVGNTNAFDVALRWGHDITTTDDPGLTFTAFTAQWVLEGTITVQDSAPQVTVNGANPIGVAPNSAYVDAGATCLDTVDGDISGSISVLLDGASAPNCDLGDVGGEGESHTCEYQCTDSSVNTATVTRTIQVSGLDTTPPVIELNAQANVDGDGRNDAADGSSVDLLTDKAYVDAGASCEDDRDGVIPLGTVGAPGFTVSPDPAGIDTGTAGTTTLTFECTDSSNNTSTATRDVNLIADDIPPELTLGGSATPTVLIDEGFSINVPPTTCEDTNPIDVNPFNLTSNVTYTPPFVDTSVEGVTVVTFTCVDDAGNSAATVDKTVTVVDVSQADNFLITSMTVTDVLDQADALGQDGIAGCFKFDPASQIDSACGGPATDTRFSSDGDPGLANISINGPAEDIDTGTGLPIGVRFGQYQPPPPVPSPGAVPPLISQGFIYAGFPFVPLTFDPPSEMANQPAGYVSVVGGAPVAMTITSFPFGGAYKSPQPNNFFLDPDEGTLSTGVFEDGALDSTFAYRMVWSHLITGTEDPTEQFVNFTSQWRTEGIVTVEATPTVINSAPLITGISADQGAGTTQIVIAGNGPVTATVTALDRDDGPTTPLAYDWVQSDSRLVPTGATTNADFTFDPAGLDEGVYALRVQVSDGEDVVSGELLIQVLAADPATGTDDTDGDGIPDVTEGTGDSDQDGIPNYLDFYDADPLRNRVDPANPGLGDIVASQGSLKLGSTAFSTGRSSFLVTEENIEDFGGPGGTPGIDPFDRLNKIVGREHSGGGIFDWRVEGVGKGGIACVVLPQAVPLPNVPIDRKYNPRTGWRDFAPGGGSTLASAMRDAFGDCPGPNDFPAWDESRGLVEGDECVRVCALDGGPNDADALRDGNVSDPGTIASNGPVPKSINSSGGCVLDVSGGATAGRHAEWWLLGGFLAWLGVARKRLLRKLRQ